MNFLEELQKLRESQPRTVINARSVNSDYSPYGANNNNCYLCYGSGGNWDCFYMFWPYKNEDCCDCAYMWECRFCYECVSCEKCYNCDYCEDCIDTYDSKFCYDCVGCNDCIGCVGLRRQKYCIFNKSYTKEEYVEAAKKIDLKRVPDEFEKLKFTVPRLYVHQKNNENCTGDYLYNSCNAHYCWDSNHLWDSGYCYNATTLKDCYDMVYAGALPAELCYECMSAVDLYNSNFCNLCWYSGNLEYCEMCFNCRDCFGCIYLNAKQFYILNKPYSEEEYKKKVAEIKTLMRQEGIYGKHLESDYPEFLAISQFSDYGKV